jgi:hypothetical protein
MSKILSGMVSFAIFLIGLAVQGTPCVPSGILHILPFGANAIEFDADRGGLDQGVLAVYFYFA